MKPINKKYFEHYSIDTHGNVYSTIHSRNGKTFNHSPKKLKSFPNKNTKYHQIVLQNKTNGIKPTCFYVHRLVAETYIPNPNNLPEVNHIIANLNDNSVGNLEWVTTAENLNHKKLFGKNRTLKIDLLISNPKLFNKGIKHYQKHNDVSYLCNLWNCSNTVVRQILKHFNIKRENYRYSSVELSKLRKCILAWDKKHYTKEFIKYVKDNTGRIPSYYFIRLQKKYLDTFK